MNYKTKTLVVAALLIALCSAWFAGLEAFTADIENINTPLIAERQLDAIVVLTGGTNRIDEGFTMLQKKAAKKLLISGVHKTVDTKQLLDRWKAEPQHELDCCVVLDFNANNTVQNAKETVKWLKRENFKSIYLVTSNYHMQRALFEFSKRAPELEIHPIQIVPKDVDMQSWWKEPYSRDLILKEYNKYITVRFIDLFFNW